MEPEGEKRIRARPRPGRRGALDEGETAMASARTAWLAAAGLLLCLSRGSHAERSCFVRGDANCDSTVDVSDPIEILRHLFVAPAPECPSERWQWECRHERWGCLSGPWGCLDRADANDDGRLNISDPIYLLDHIFLGGPAPPDPWPEPGEDPTPDRLPCHCWSALPRLEERDAGGGYSPYYATQPMKRPRYFHQAVASAWNLAIVLGGSDERGFSGIDTVEMFDQSTWAKDRPRPESLAGLWIDTDFEGDPMVLAGGPRLLFTASRVRGKILAIGGTGDLVGAPVVKTVAVFDPDTRTSVPLAAEMAIPRCRHTATELQDGSILICGGQVETTIAVEVLMLREGSLGIRRDVTVFGSTPEVEVYLPSEGVFEPLTLPGTGEPSRLRTPRGRAGHAAARLAGPDGILGSADDLVLVAGGLQTHDLPFAPRNKLPGLVARGVAEGVTTLEIFDPSARAFSRVGNVELRSPRINDPHIVNLGNRNDVTTDGVLGLGNVLLVTHGNDDAACPATAVGDDILVATYTGFGPAHGLQIVRVDARFGSHTQGIEYAAQDPSLAVGRCASNPVDLPRTIAVAPDVWSLQTWVFALGGAHVSCCPCTFHLSADHPTLGAGCVFDPSFSLVAVQFGLSPRNLAITRSSTHPTGVVGTWLTLDGDIPGDAFASPPYSGTPTDRWAAPSAPARVWHRNIPLPGEDGVIGTRDDRILLAGGGTSYEGFGGEPATPSAEIFIPPGANAALPGP